MSSLASPGAVLEGVQQSGVVVVPGFWSGDRCAAAAQAVLDAEADWVADFAGLQFCLGRAWYTHLETEQSGAYFAKQSEADAIVERHLPGLQQAMRDVVSQIVGAPAVARRGWCGAGVHIFPARGRCARVGGSIHFDYEGLTKAQLRAHAPALSLVLMLQAPEDGGGLRVWDVVYTDHDEPTPSEKRSAHETLAYAAGDLVVFDSHRLHQIRPFDGDRARISVTLHGVQTLGRWETWF